MVEKGDYGHEEKDEKKNHVILLTKPEQLKYLTF